jgi:hypothetical protein
MTFGYLSGEEGSVIRGQKCLSLLANEDSARRRRAAGECDFDGASPAVVAIRLAMAVSSRHGSREPTS